MPDSYVGRNTIEHKRGLLTETHEVVVCLYVAPTPTFVQGSQLMSTLKQSGNNELISYGVGSSLLEADCGTQVTEAFIDGDSEYDPLTNSQVIVSDSGRTLEFTGISTWTGSGGQSNPKVKGTFKTKIDGFSWILEA